MRIIAGQFKGRRLLSPRHQTTRPITDRVKVALFDIMTPRLADAAVADLFCGTGSLGLEALSRGVRHCWFAERDPSALDLLRRNLHAVGAAERATIWQGDIPRRLGRWLTQLEAPLDVVFLDPPYALARQWHEGPPAQVRAHASFLQALADALAPQGLVVFRTPKKLALQVDTSPLAPVGRKEYGTTALNFLQRQIEADRGRCNP